MNFLAHFYLSKSDENIIVGNFLGDFVKGKKYEMYPKEIQKGILIHRLIDSYTDNHKETKSALKFLYPQYGKYSAVILDVFFDYCLAIQWEKYSNKKLKDFSKGIYETLSRFESLFDERQKKSFEHMRSHDWLNGYAQKSGIKMTLSGLSRRASFKNEMAKSSTTLFENKNFFIEKFTLLFKDLIQFSEETKNISLDKIKEQL